MIFFIIFFFPIESGPCVTTSRGEGPGKTWTSMKPPIERRAKSGSNSAEVVCSPGSTWMVSGLSDSMCTPKKFRSESMARKTGTELWWPSFVKCSMLYAVFFTKALPFLSPKENPWPPRP